LGDPDRKVGIFLGIPKIIGIIEQPQKYFKGYLFLGLLGKNSHTSLLMLFFLFLFDFSKLVFGFSNELFSQRNFFGTVDAPFFEVRKSCSESGQNKEEKRVVP